MHIKLSHRDKNRPRMVYRALHEGDEAIEGRCGRSVRWYLSAYRRNDNGCEAVRRINELTRIIANEFVTEPVAIGLDQPGGRMRKMDRQHKSTSSGDLAQEPSARLRRLCTVPVEDRRPIRLAALQGVMHEVSDDDGALSARADIDAAMTRRVAGRWREPQRIVELIIVIHQQCLSGRDHRLTIVPPYVTGGRVATLRRFLPGGVFAFMEHVLRLREGRHPAAVTQHGVPAAMVDVQMCAEHIIYVVEFEPGITESVEPRLLWEVHRRRIALVLAGAGVHQDRSLRRAHDVCLVGDHQASRGRIKHLRIEFGKISPSGVRVIGGKHVLWPPPWSVPLDDAGDGDVADLKGAHFIRSPPVASIRKRRAIRRAPTYFPGFAEHQSLLPPSYLNEADRQPVAVECP